jgi:DNA-binding transcriptional LysR family regulator
MELRVLRYFLAVAREESITGAAQSLHVTQPTLSKQLMDLEEELGRKLFLRGSRKITLTEDGMFFRKRAQEIVDLAEKTQAEFSALAEVESGDVYIGGGETRAMGLIARTVRRLHDTCPGIRYHLYSGNGEDVAERLDKGLLDFGLFVGLIDFKKYDYLKLPMQDTWGLVMRQDDPLAHLDAIRPEDLAGVSILCSRQALIQNELSGWLGYDFGKLNIIATYNLIYNASLMVREGLGCALCIDGLLDVFGTQGLCFRPFEPRVTADLVIAWKKYQVFSRAAETFLNALQEDLAAHS